MNLTKAFTKLNRLYESKEDKERFIAKFGEEIFDLFQKSKQRLKNKNISTDIVWHTKYSTKKDLEAILINLQNRTITKDGDLTTAAGEYKELGEADGFKVYEILDHIAAINLGVDTGWCISGRYNHYKEKNYNPTESEAKKHWDDYAKVKARIYFFLNPNEKYAVVIYPETNIPLIDFNIELEDGKIANTTNFEVFTETDELDQSLIQTLPYDLLPQKLDFKWTQEVENNTQELANAIERERETATYYLVLLHGKGRTLVLFSGRDKYLATIIFKARLDHLKSGHKLLKAGLVEVLELRQLSLEKDSTEDKEFRREVNNKWATSNRGLIILPDSLLGKTKENFLADYTDFINGGGVAYTNREEEKFTDLKFLNTISDSTYRLALETTDEETIIKDEKEIEKFLNNLKQYL